MLEHLQPQHRVDAVAGMQDQVLAHPGHGGGEGHEHRQPDADDGQGIERVVNDDLVDDDLGEYVSGFTFAIGISFDKRSVIPTSCLTWSVEITPSFSVWKSLSSNSESSVRAPEIIPSTPFAS